MSLKQSYTLIAPFYDALLARVTRAARQHSLGALPATPSKVLLAGVGTGLDLPHLPRQHDYVGLDLTEAMLGRARPRLSGLNVELLRGDVQRMPLADASFDAAVLHLILAVVPEPHRCLREIERIIKPGGSVLVFDKFLRRGQPALLRRMANPLVRQLATRLDVVFEDVLEHTPGLALEHDQPTLAGGWFRLIRLRRV